MKDAAGRMVPEVVIDNGDGTISGAQVAATATIASSASLSGTVDMTYLRLARIVMPAAWDAAVLTFQVSHDGTNFFNLYDSLGNEYTVQAAASRAIMIPFADFIGVRYVKIRSGTSGSAVNQTAQRALTLVSQ